MYGGPLATVNAPGAPGPLERSYPAVSPVLRSPGRSPGPHPMGVDTPRASLSGNVSWTSSRSRSRSRSTSRRPP